MALIYVMLKGSILWQYEEKSRVKRLKTSLNGDLQQKLQM